MSTPTWNGRDDEAADDTPRTLGQWLELGGECLLLLGILCLVVLA